MTGNLELLNKFKKLENKDFRHFYMNDHIRVCIATQIKLLRTKAGLTQIELAAKVGTKQTVISRLEDPDGGTVNLSTLFKIAKAFDICLITKFVPFGRFIEESEKISPDELYAKNFDSEYSAIKNNSTKHLFNYFVSKSHLNKRNSYSDFDHFAISTSQPRTLKLPTESGWSYK